MSYFNDTFFPFVLAQSATPACSPSIWATMKPTCVQKGSELFFSFTCSRVHASWFLKIQEWYSLVATVFNVNNYSLSKSTQPITGFVSKKSSRSLPKHCWIILMDNQKKKSQLVKTTFRLYKPQQCQFQMDRAHVSGHITRQAGRSTSKHVGLIKNENGIWKLMSLWEYVLIKILVL